MKAYHGTTKENKESILKDGFRIDIPPRKGRMHGDAIYLTTRKKWAKEFGDSIVEVEINDDYLEYFYDGEEYWNLWEDFMRETLYPFQTIEEYIFDKMAIFKELSFEEMKVRVDSIYQDAEYRIGSAFKEYFINRGIKGFAVLFSDKKPEYFDVTVYDMSILKVLKILNK